MKGFASTDPCVSVIVPNRNKVAFVSDTITSIMRQHHLADLIVVDDASSDGSYEILQKLASTVPHVRLIRLHDRIGGAAARNVGLSVATSKYVMFVDSDDLLSHDCLKRRVQAATEAPDNDLWVFPMQTFQDNARLPKTTWIPQCRDNLRAFLSFRIPWAIMQPLWNRKFLECLGGFNEAFQRLQDIELHTRALLSNARVKCFASNAPDCFYRVIDNRHSESTEKMAWLHTENAIRYYQYFWPIVGTKYKSALGRTLLMAIAQNATERRRRKVSPTIYRHNSDLLISACRNRTQRSVLAMYAELEAQLPLRIPGVRLLASLLVEQIRAN